MSRAWLALGLVAIGLGFIAVAVLGPFVTGVIDYHVTETLRNQTIGLDVVSLFVVAPLSVVASVLVLRGHGRCSGWVSAHTRPTCSSSTSSGPTTWVSRATTSSCLPSSQKPS